MPAAPAAPEAPGAEAENPRTTRSRERLELACTAISEYLGDGEWHSSNALHVALKEQVSSEGMYGRAKQALGIQHRRVRPADGGRAEYEWRMPPAKPAPKRRAKA